MRVTSVEYFPEYTEEVYDFEVEEDSCFFAGHGTPILKHNCHQAAAKMFSRLLGRIDARRKLGLTATLFRKDGLTPVVNAILGPSVAKGNAASDLPLIELMETGVGVGRNYSNWAAMTSFLIRMRERNKILIRAIFRNLRDHERNCVLVTTTRREHVEMLVKMINAQGQFCNQNRDENWPTQLAIPYMGGKDTNAVLNMASTGRARVVVAMASMVQHGLDVARWTHVYIGVVPTSNIYNTYQLINRVCTPYSEELEAKIGPKPQSHAIIVLDALAPSVFCFAKLYKDRDFGILAGTTHQNDVGVPIYRVAPESLARMDSIAKFPRSYSPEEAGVKVQLGRTRTGKRRRKSLWKPVSTGVTRL